MTFTLTVSCDAAGCGASALVGDPEGPDAAGGEFPPSIADGTLVTWDVGWVTLPEGWVCVEGGERCPEHA